MNNHSIPLRQCRIGDIVTIAAPACPDLEQATPSTTTDTLDGSLRNGRPHLLPAGTTTTTKPTGSTLPAGGVGSRLVVVSRLRTTPATGEVMGEWLDVYAEDVGLTTVDADTPVTVHTTTGPREPDGREAAHARDVRVLRDALAELARELDNATAEHRARATAHWTHIERVRHTLIDTYTDGRLDLAVLDDVLAHAGLAPYRPRLRVRFTITGHYDVPGTTDDIPDVRRLARRLRVDATPATASPTDTDPSDRPDTGCLDVAAPAGVTAEIVVRVEEVTPIG